MRNATFIVYKDDEPVGTWTTDIDANIVFTSDAITHFFPEAEIVMSESSSAYAKMGDSIIWAYLIDDNGTFYPDPMRVGTVKVGYTIGDMVNYSFEDGDPFSEDSAHYINGTGRITDIFDGGSNGTQYVVDNEYELTEDDISQYEEPAGPEAYGLGISNEDNYHHTAQVDAAGVTLAVGDMVEDKDGAELQIESFNLDGTFRVYLHGIDGEPPLDEGIDLGNTTYNPSEVTKIAKAEKAPSKPHAVGTTVSFEDADEGHMEGKVTSHEEANRTYRYTVHVPTVGDYDVHHSELKVVKKAALGWKYQCYAPVPETSQRIPFGPAFDSEAEAQTWGVGNLGSFGVGAILDGVYDSSWVTEMGGSLNGTDTSGMRVMSSCPLCHGEVESVDGYGARTASRESAYASCTCCGALWDSWESYEAQAGVKTSKIYLVNGYLKSVIVEADSEEEAEKKARAQGLVASADNQDIPKTSIFDEAHNSSATDWLGPLAAKAEKVQNERSVEAEVKSFLDTLNLDQLSSADYVKQAALKVNALSKALPDVEYSRRVRYARYIKPVADKTTVESTVEVPLESIFN